MRGLMPFIALAIVGTYGLMVLLGLAGVAYGGYWLISSDWNSGTSSRSGANNSTYTPIPPPIGGNTFKSTPPIGGKTSPPAFNPPNFNPPGRPGGNFPNRPGFTSPDVGGQNTAGVDVNANSNAVLKRFFGTVQVKASSEWNGWPARNVIDGNPTSSWFPTSSPDAKEGPWLLLTFPQDAAIKRVTVLGNRDATWTGYSIQRMKVEFLNATEQVQHTVITSPTRASDFVLENLNLPSIRKIRVTTLQDGNGTTGRSQQVGISEIQVE